MTDSSKDPNSIIPTGCCNGAVVADAVVQRQTSGQARRLPARRSEELAVKEEQKYVAIYPEFSKASQSGVS